MKKNITDLFQQHINETIKKPPVINYVETIEDEKTKLFTKLCMAQRDGRLKDYEIMLETMKLSYFAFKK
jgi:hypothetical protein